MSWPRRIEPVISRAVRGWRRLGLATKLALAASLATAVVVGLVFLGLGVETRARTRELFGGELARSQQTIAALQTQRLQDLVWTASLVAQSPTLRAAMDTYRDELSGRESNRSQLLATVRHAIEANLANLDHDLLVVVSQDGIVLGAATRGGAPPRTGLDLSAFPAVRRELDPGASSNSEPSAVLDLHNEHFQVTSAPIEVGGYPIGVLLLGDRLAGTFVQRLAATFDGWIVVATPATIIASTRRGAILPTDLPIGRTGQGRPGSAPEILRLGGEEFAVASVPLGVDKRGQPVVVYLLESVSQAVARIETVNRRQFAIYGTLAVLLVGLAAGGLTGTLLDPLRRFVGFMRSVAGSRDYMVRFDATPAGPEIKSLKASYDSLMESLEQEHTTLAERSRQLADTNEALWEQMRERERIQRALDESEKQLRQSQKLEAVGTLAGGVAHDFNNLLTVIIGHSQMLLEALEPESPHQRDVDQIRAAADRAASLTRQLLAFSRRQVLQPKTLDLVSVVQGVGSLLRRLIGEDVRLKTSFPTGPAWVRADPTQLEQVLMNLAVNARDAMPEGGTLSIAVRTGATDEPRPSFLPTDSTGWVELVVADTGTGMDEETKERIFEPFFTTKEPGRGTGLGLSTVYGIVEQSGGHIAVESAPGRGTEFRVRLPEAVPEPEAPDARAVELEARGHETILLVEDEEEVRHLAAKALSRGGYVVLEAANAAEALEIAGRCRGPLHLLLTDMIMPGENGRQLRERLTERRPALKAMYMSGYPSDLLANRGPLEAETPFLQKPFTPAVLLQRVRLALDDRPEPEPAHAGR